MAKKIPKNVTIEPDLDKFAKSVREKAVAVFKKDGFHTPFVFMYDEDKKINVVDISSFLVSPKTKQLLPSLLKMIGKKTKATAYMMIVEAYMVKMEKVGSKKDEFIDENGDYIQDSVTNSSERIETLQILFRSKECSRMWTYEIVREGEEKPTLRFDAEHQDTDGKIAGQMLPDIFS